MKDVSLPRGSQLEPRVVTDLFAACEGEWVVCHDQAHCRDCPSSGVTLTSLLLSQKAASALSEPRASPCLPSE